MAVKFLEPGGDALFTIPFTNGLWYNIGGSPAIVSDFVHGNHQRSTKFTPGSQDQVGTDQIGGDTGTRISFWIYLNALPTGTAPNEAQVFLVKNSTTGILTIKMTTGGKFKFFNNSNVQIGSTGTHTLSTGVWYRICLAYTISSTSSNKFNLFVDGASDITLSNGSLGATGSTQVSVGNLQPDASLDFRLSDFYVDDSSALTDTGQIWVTAKRPFANGTNNDFITQIGSGGSGYGTGHAPQVNERPTSSTNGWSKAVTDVTTEEYNIENLATGDFDLTGAVIIDMMGWVKAKSLSSETASIVVKGTRSNISLTSTTNIFIKMAGSTIYPQGTGEDIGIDTTSLATTVSLYEAGIIVAFRPTGISPSSSVSLSPSPSSSVSLSISKSPSASQSPSSSISLSPSSSVSASASPSQSPSASVSSSISLSPSPSSSASLSISLSPSSSVSLSISASPSPSSSDSLSISLSPSSSQSPSVSLSSSVSLSISLSPSASGSDSPSFSASSSVSLSISLSPSSSASPSPSPAVYVNETKHSSIWVNESKVSQ